MINAVATLRGLNQTRLIKLPSSNAITIAGKLATTILQAKRCAEVLRFKPEIACHKRDRNNQHTAKMAPNWITISKILPRSSLKFNKSPTTIKCPVLDMGKNSVSPSTTPKIKAFNINNASKMIPSAKSSEWPILLKMN